MEDFTKKINEIYKSIYEDSPEGILIIDEEGKILHANSKALQTLGYSLNYLKNKDFHEFIENKDSEKDFIDFFNLQLTNTECYDIFLKGKNKKKYQANIIIKALNADGGRFYAIFFQNVTEHRHPGLGKPPSDDLLTNIFEAIRDGIAILDRDLNILKVNPWIEEKYVTHAPLRGKKCYRVFQQRKEPCPCCPSLRAMETGKPQHAQVPYPSELKTEGWLDLFCYPTQDKNGRVVGVVEYIRDVTKEKKLQIALTEKEERFRNFFENPAVVAYITSRDGKIVEINEAALRILGYKREEIGKMNALNFYVNPDERKRFIHEIEHKGVVKDFPISLRTKDGSIRLCLNTASLIKDAHGNTLYQGIIQDFTEYFKLQNALKENEKKYRSFFENSPVPTYISSIEGKFLDFNQATSDLLGYDKEELFHLGISETYQDPKERERFINAVKNKGYVQDFPVKLKHKNGKIISAEISATNFMDSEKNITGFQGIIRDVTEQKSRERALFLFNILLNQTDAEIIITDLNGTIEYVNPAFEKITGYSAKEVKGRNPRILKSGKHDDAFYKNLWETITSGKSWTGRFYNKRKDGTYYYEDAHVFPIRDKRGHIVNFAAIKREITHEVMLEEQLSQAAKLEAIGKLAGSIAHDFNNILTSIQGFAGLGLSKISPQHPLNHELSEILKASKQASRITQQLLGFSRKQIISPKAVSARAIIRDMIPLLERYIGEDITLETSLIAENDVIVADRGQIEQCVLNLVINARDAIREKKNRSEEKTVLIELQSLVIDDLYLKKHTGITKGAYLVIAVSDTGVGMDKETLEKIFDPFFTTKPPGEGTGLGCSTVFGIVKQNGGNIRAYSEPGLGTTMKIYWPLAEKGTVVETSEEESRLPVTVKGHETILVVEDDRGIREFVTQALSSYGYTVFSAEDGEKALKLINEKKPSIDLLFTDVIMPKMNGNELADILSKKFTNLKVLFSSGYTENYITHDGLLSPHIHFLHKPYTIQSLLKKIRTVLDK